MINMNYNIFIRILNIITRPKDLQKVINFTLFKMINYILEQQLNSVDNKYKYQLIT